MLKSVRRGLVLGCGSSFLNLLGCGAPPPQAPAAASAADSPRAVAPPGPVPAPAPAAEPAPEAKPEPQLSPGFAEALASLRPTGTGAALQALTATPAAAEPYAQGALAYAATDAPAMTLLWGMSYQAMGGGKQDAAVAAALAKVLTSRVTASRDQQTKELTFNLRLAPGQMPVRKDPDGSVHAPLAHVFESLFSPAVTGFEPPWSLEQFYDVLSNWVGFLATHGSPLDDSLELDGWLVSLAKQGHLEAFCYRLLGPAFPAELKAFSARHAAQLKAYQDFSKQSALHPKRAALPDDLVRIQ